MSFNFSDPHLSDLKDKFPETPDSIILKADVLREGLQFTKDLAEIGQWSIPNSAFISREGLPKEEAKDFKADFYSIPYQFILGDDTRVSTILDSNSNYTIRKEVEGGYSLYRLGKPITEVFFKRRPAFIDKPMPDGSSYNELISQRSEECMATMHSIYCVYAKNREQCAYCVLGNKLSGRKLNDILKITPSLSSKMDALALAANEIDIKHIVLSGGSSNTLSAEAKAYSKVVKTTRNIVGPKTKLHVCSQPLHEDGWLLLKECGTDVVQPNIEVWDEKLWPEIIPGKAKAASKTEIIERLKSAVDVFGPGNVATNFVAGAESLCGKSFDEELESHLEGFATLLSFNIVPIFGFLSKAKDTKYENITLPPIEFYLKLGWERTKLMKESGMYQKYGAMHEHDFSCYKCVSHKTGQDYSRLLNLAMPENR